MQLQLNFSPRLVLLWSDLVSLYPGPARQCGGWEGADWVSSGMLGWFILACHNRRIMGTISQAITAIHHTPFNEQWWNVRNHFIHIYIIYFIIRTTTRVNFYWISSSPRKQSHSGKIRVILMKRKSKLYQWHYSTIHQVANCYNKITDQRKYFMLTPSRPKIFHGTNTSFVPLVSTWMIGKFLLDFIVRNLLQTMLEIISISS